MVGERVLTARKSAGLSQKELSEISGVSVRYVAQLEQGNCNVSIGVLTRLSIALGISVHTIMRSNDPATAEANRIAALYRSADAATRTRLVELLETDQSIARKAQRICLVGLRGAGKSTLGRRAAQELGLPFVELKEEIEKSAGIPIAEIFALYGDSGYRELEAETIERLVTEQSRFFLAVAGGIVTNPDTFAALLSRFHLVWLRARPGDHMDRVRDQGDLRPMAGNPRAMLQLREILRTREEQYSKAPYHLDTSGKSVETSHSELIELLRENSLI
jgi:XRE family aerobic/anaerobic benzoate catabolism transcriptional regulator